MSGYQDLSVWKKSMSVSVSVYELTKQLPKEETYGLISQMRRAAVSIASNIAEGHGRRSKGDFDRFLSIANGSKAELETQLLLCELLKYLKNEEIKNLMDDLKEIGKMIYGLQSKITINKLPSSV